MGQFGFFDADRRLAATTAKGDPLEMIARVVPFISLEALYEIQGGRVTDAAEEKVPSPFDPRALAIRMRGLATG